MGMDIHQTSCPSRHKGGTWGVLRGQQFKNKGKLSDLHQLWFTSADSSLNGHRLNTSRPSIPQGDLGGRWSQIQKSWEAVKRLHRLAPNLVQVSAFIWEWTYAKYNSPHNTPGAFRGLLGGQKFKCLGSVKRLERLAPNLVQICGFVWEWTWAKYNSPLNSPGGFRGGHKFKSLGKLSNKWTDRHQIWYTSAYSSGEWT